MTELHGLHRAYTDVVFKYRTVVGGGKYPTALVHCLFMFPREIQLYGDGCFNQNLQRICHEVHLCSTVGVMPLDFRSDNLLALAALASFDDKSSACRDQLWRTLCKGVVTPDSEPVCETCLPPPAPPCPAIPLMSPLPYQPGNLLPLEKRARSRTPEPRAREKTPRVPGDLPRATGRLLEFVGDLWRASIEDFAPGTQVFLDRFRGVELCVPEWIFNVLEYNADPLYKDKRGTAATVFGSSMIRCLKIFAKAIDVCALALFRASRAVLLILRDGLNSLPQLPGYLHEALEACKGVTPVVEAFRRMKPDPLFPDIGAKPDTGDLIMPLLEMPAVILTMSEGNRVKNMYRFMFMASTRLEEMCPDDDVYICWDRIARKLGELQQYLYLAHGECEALVKYCAQA